MTPRRPRRSAVPTTAAGLGLLAALALGLTLVSSARAATFCDRGGEVPATEQDRQLQVVAVARRVLVASGVEAALVSRSGTDLSRFQLQYSHSGLALKDSRNGPWSVRQLYYACDESRARLYDQGLAGFLLSAGKTAPIRLAIVTLPGEAGSRLAARALDNRLALALLSPRYSASAYAFATRYQNCNQWVAELMGFAWQPREDDAPTPDRVQAPVRHQLQVAVHREGHRCLRGAPGQKRVQAVPEETTCRFTRQALGKLVNHLETCEPKSLRQPRIRNRAPGAPKTASSRYRAPGALVHASGRASFS